MEIFDGKIPLKSSEIVHKIHYVLSWLMKLKKGLQSHAKIVIDFPTHSGFHHSINKHLNDENWLLKFDNNLIFDSKRLKIVFANF